MRKPLCIVVPPDLQDVLVATGLVRCLAALRPVLVALSKEHVRVSRRLFKDVDARYWFGCHDPVARARALDMPVLSLPRDPRAMYNAAALPITYACGMFDVDRDMASERRIVEDVVGRVGQSFIVTWSTLSPHALPEGVPTVDATSIETESPLDYCSLIQHALQVHAPDGWFLTLARVLGARSLWCHAYAGSTTPSQCRRRYGRSVRVITSKNS